MKTFVLRTPKDELIKILHAESLEEIMNLKFYIDNQFEAFEWSEIAESMNCQKDFNFKNKRFDFVLENHEYYVLINENIKKYDLDIFSGLVQNRIEKLDDFKLVVRNCLELFKNDRLLFV